MRFKIARSALLEGLQVVQNIVSIRSTLPILSNVLLLGEEKRLWLTTTDLDVSVRCGLDAEVSRTGATTLPVKRLSGIVRELPDVDIEVEVGEKATASIKCESSFFKVVGLSEEEFPPVPKPEGESSFRLEQGVFKEMLRKTAYAASTDETRYVLNGVLMSFKDRKLTIVATDGRRLALVEHEVEFPKEAEAELILPSKTVAELLHVLKDVGELRIFLSDKRAIFEFDSVVISSKLIEGQYPNYRQVIPSQCEERVIVERESLLTALRRVSLFTTDSATPAKLTFAKNKLLVSTVAPDVGEAREQIPIKYSGKEIEIAFNPDFMMDPLKNLANDEIYIEIIDSMSPGVIKCDIPFLYVLMPMRV